MRDAGQILGEWCRRHLVTSVGALVEALRQEDHDLRGLLLFVMSLRKRRSRPGLYQTVLDTLRTPDTKQPRWVSLLMREVYGVYCSLRRSAARRSQQPEFQPEVALPVGRRLVHQLQFHGVTLPLMGKWELAKAATDTLRRLWSAMRGRGVVLWFDNFFKPRYVYNPARLHGTLNATVMSVLGTGSMTTGHNWPDPADLGVRQQRALQWLMGSFARLLQRTETVADTNLTSRHFRVPLDAPRRAVTSLPWRPFSLNDDVVQTQQQLLKILAFCHRIVSTHVRPPMPLLVDENIAYRVQKMCYAQPTQSWAVRGFLRDLPVLYGVWHPYKYVVEVVYRTFLPLFVFLLRGTVPVGFAIPSLIKLRTQEMWLGAILLIPLQDRRRLHHLAVRLQQDLDTLQLHLRGLLDEWHRRPAAGVLATMTEFVDSVLNEDVQPAAFTRIRDHVPQYAQVRAEHFRHLQIRIRRAWQAHQLLTTKVMCVWGMDRLVNEFAPACLVVGTLVRQCSWVWRQNGTGHRARETLQYCLLLLVRLLEGVEHKREYVRTLSTALLLWSDWHDSIPAAWYCEEPNEAALSRLSSLCKRHTQHVSTRDVHDLWMNVSPGSPAPHDLPHGGVPQDTARAVYQHFMQYLAADGRGVTSLPWNPQGQFKLSYAIASWPDAFRFPDTLRRRPSSSHLGDLLKYMRRTLHEQRQISEQFMDALDHAVGRRPESDVEADTRVIQEQLSRDHIPQRYRS